MNSYIPPASLKGGRYVPKKVLGIGTYGQVLLCADQLVGGDVAVKVAQSNPAYRRSAMNEICALQKLLDNANCVRLLDVFEDSGHVCIVTELLDKNLFELLRDRGFIPLMISDIKKVCRRVLQALTALHRVGFMHCDIKPENIMLRKVSNVDKFSNNALVHINEHASKVFPHKVIQSDSINKENDSCQKCIQDELIAFSLSSSSDCGEEEVDFDQTCLIDFGAVRQFNENDYYDVQSLWYRAPEVLCGLPYTAKIDSWSVGCLLAELYSGKPLFPAENVEDQLSYIVQLVGYPSQSALNLGNNVKQFRLPEVRTNRQATALQVSNWIKICRHHNLQWHQNRLTPQSHPQNQGLGIERLSNTPCSSSILNAPISSEPNLHNLHNLHNPTSSAEEALLINLIIHLLCPDEQHRLSCEEALQHPFLSASPSNTYASFPFTNSPQQRPTSSVLSGSSSFPNSSLIGPTISPIPGFPPGCFSPPSLVNPASSADPNLLPPHPNIPPPPPQGLTLLPKTCLMPFGAGFLPAGEHPAAGGGQSPYFVMRPSSPRKVFRVPMVLPVPVNNPLPGVASQSKGRPPPPPPALYAPVYVSMENKRLVPVGSSLGGGYPPANHHHHNSTHEIRRLGTTEDFPHGGRTEVGGRLPVYPSHSHYVASRTATVVTFP
ncbi:unnamed protein product [Phytomonas sp. EM1]|nr:unnamed protein product [Phytomonas sp. EM1]|eukprot:CCW63904.1 unnamed protein product [Phytomonas sp. isolate EM1]